jgi:hypothetical protein
MNGPATFNQGGPMSKKVEQAPSWSADDVTFANKFLELSHQLPGTFAEKKDAAARAMSGNGFVYDSYSRLPKGVLRYIAHEGALAAKRKKAKAQELRGREEQVRLQQNVRLAEADWIAAFNALGEEERLHMVSPDELEDGRYLVQQ